jgi:acyl-CoA synthetase (AMP-forming)/AMP-acid ligase II
LTKLPIGVAGELLIQGVGVARGYWQRDELTKQRFLDAPLFGRDERVYRTGDLVRRRGDGRLEYLGRIDRQIKLRGYRIELDEIEAQLRACEGVEAAAVQIASIDGGAPFLAAYYVANDDDELDDDDVRQHCTERMPRYMVPSVFMRLERLPLNANDKVDYKALPKPNTIKNNDDADDEDKEQDSGVSYEKVCVEWWWCVLTFL